MSLSVTGATAADIPALTAIFDAAFRTDRHTRVKELGRGAGTQAAAMGDAIAAWLDDPVRCAVLKAVDDTTGEIVGWTCWSRRGYQDQPPPAARPSPAPAGTSPLDVLESVTAQDMDRWQRILMPPGTRCRILNAIAVSPATQGQGAGSALIRWGTTRADEDGVFCWVHASEAGFPVFAKHGFTELGRLEVDLDEYAPAPPGDDHTWGRYTFRYLKRMPAP